MPAAHPSSGDKHDRHGNRSAPLLWLPAALLGAGLALGLALWSKWGLAVAFEAIRTYCF